MTGRRRRAVTSRAKERGAPWGARRRGTSSSLHTFHFVFPRTYQFEYLNHAGQYYNVKASPSTLPVAPSR